MMRVPPRRFPTIAPTALPTDHPHAIPYRDRHASARGELPRFRPPPARGMAAGPVVDGKGHLVRVRDL
jgi:hypothetical protein